MPRCPVIAIGQARVCQAPVHLRALFQKYLLLRQTRCRNRPSLVLRRCDDTCRRQNRRVRQQYLHGMLWVSLIACSDRRVGWVNMIGMARKRQQVVLVILVIPACLQVLWTVLYSQTFDPMARDFPLLAVDSVQGTVYLISPHLSLYQCTPIHKR